MNANQRTYGYRDLIRTYILDKRFENAAPPLRGYYSELYSILSSFFGVDLDRIPGGGRPESFLVRNTPAFFSPAWNRINALTVPLAVTLRSRDSSPGFTELTAENSTMPRRSIRTHALT